MAGALMQPKLCLRMYDGLQHGFTAWLKSVHLVFCRSLVSVHLVFYRSLVSGPLQLQQRMRLFIELCSRSQAPGMKLQPWIVQKSISIGERECEWENAKFNIHMTLIPHSICINVKSGINPLQTNPARGNLKQISLLFCFSVWNTWIILFCEVSRVKQVLCLIRFLREASFMIFRKGVCTYGSANASVHGDRIALSGKRTPQCKFSDLICF